MTRDMFPFPGLLDKYHPAPETPDYEDDDEDEHPDEIPQTDPDYSE